MLPKSSTGHAAGEGGEVELDRLAGAGEVVDAEDDVLGERADVREDLRVLRPQHAVVAEAEDRVLLAQLDEAAQPAQERGRQAQLRLDVDRLEAVDGVHQRRQVELGEVGAREAAVPVAGPLHRRPDAVAVAEVDVVAHGDLVSVVEDGRTGEREEDRVHQLDLVAAAVEERREPAADAEVELHPRVLGVLLVHVVALLVGDHLERQLVVVAEEEAPLRVVAGSAAVRSRISIIGRASSRRSDMNIRGITGKWKAMWHSSRPVAEVGNDVLGPLVRLGQEDAVGVVRVDLGAHALQVLVRARQVLAVRPSSSKRYGTASRRKPSSPRSSQKRSTSIIASCTAGFS